MPPLLREKLDSPFVRLGAFLCMAVLAVVFGLMLPTGEKTSEWYKDVSFYNIFACFILWVSTWPLLSWNREQALLFARRHAPAFLLAVLIVAGALMTSPPRFRILSDEANLAGTAEAMYDQRQAFNPTQMIFYYEGMSEVVSREWDIRPLLYPFLIYLAHSCLGFSVDNSFVVNAFAGVFLLFAFYLFLERWFSRFFGVLGMMLLAAVPLLILWITSGGFEAVNLLFAILAFLAFDHFLVHRKVEQAEFLTFTLLLLAQARYESGLFAVAMLPFLFFFLPWKEYGRLSGRAFLLPVLFLPLVWHRMMIKADAYLLPGMKDVFSYEHFKEHLAPAWEFFRGTTSWFGMIPLYFWCFWLALLFLALDGWKRRKEHSSRGIALVTAAAGSVALYCIILFSYYMGDLARPWTVRLGVIFLPFLVTPIVWALFRITRGGAWGRNELFIMALGLMTFFWPVAGANEAARLISGFREMNGARQYLEANFSKKHTLILAVAANLYSTMRYSAVGIGHANTFPEDILGRLEHHMYNDIIAIQHIRLAGNVPPPEGVLVASYSTEILFETKLTDDEFLRYSRVTRAKSQPASTTPPFPDSR